VVEEVVVHLAEKGEANPLGGPPGAGVPAVAGTAKQVIILEIISTFRDSATKSTVAISRLLSSKLAGFRRPPSCTTPILAIPVGLDLLQWNPAKRLMLPSPL
jgi:hypothetical protein